MRDRKRIKPLLNQLEELWEEVPDWRFLQLIINILDCAQNQRDAFFIEDDDFAQMIYKSQERYIPKKKDDIL